MSTNISKLAPIALFVYNRPQHTKRTIESLLGNSESQYSDLYIFSDAPKSESAALNVRLVRQYIREVAGFNSITIVERENNWGLANSIIEGVTRLCSEYDNVIVLEDDLYLSPHFLAYMNTSLRRYADNEKVMQIAGYMFPNELNTQNDALFLPFISSWGWATWSSAWAKFNPSASRYPELESDSKKIKEFNLNGNYNYFKMLQNQQLGKTNSWAIRWYLSVFFLKGLTLYPKNTLVENIGFDGSGENCIVSTIKTSNIDSTFKVNIFPEFVKTTEQIEDVYRSLPKPAPKIHLIKNFVKRILRK